MTRDDIIKLAREAGGYATNFNGRWMFYMADVERFAALVAAAEREACARLCEELDKKDSDGEWGHYLAGWSDGTEDCAVAIRARGQA